MRRVVGFFVRYPLVGITLGVGVVGLILLATPLSAVVPWLVGGFAALVALREVERRFPQSEYAADARLKIDLVRDHLAGKEMDIGRFYEKSGKWTAAQIRFQNVVENYQTTSHAAEALYRLTETSLALGIPQEAKKYAAVLGANYPGSEWYDKAYALVEDHAADTQVALAN